MENKKELEARWENLKPRLVAYVYTAVKDKNDAEDIVQEAFIKAFTKIHTLKEIDKLPQWLFSITRNELNAFFNAKKKEPLFIPAEEGTETFDDTIDRCISPFINSLPQKYSEAVQLALMENVSQKELAKRLNISYSGAKSRVQRGKEQLKKLFVACCTIQHDSYGNIIDYTPKKGGYCATNC